jgi:UDP-glucose 4-epimerase
VVKEGDAMNILVTGGAGYIGSNTCVELLNAGYNVIIADDLSNAREDVPERIEKITGKKAKFYRADVKDRDALEKIFRENDIDAVIHFAGFKAVGESCTQPIKYYENNLCGTITLIKAMEKFGCKRLVFSSSATVYGPENDIPYVETMKTGSASNPYGWTKIMIEQILKDWAAVDEKLSIILLRYFNPIGAHESGLLGDDPNGIPNNLMPYIGRVATGELKELTVFGGDYPTPDGTCQRDYLHVTDLARGHLKALDYAMEHTGVEAINLGAGEPVSVLELVNAFQDVNNVPVPYKIGPRRAGDLPAFYADAHKAKELLNWQTEKSVDDMCRDTWRFAKNRQ